MVWVYDSLEYPFFKGEKYHQFHPNTVLGRYVPPSYTNTLKTAQEKAGRLELQGCGGSFGVTTQTNPLRLMGLFLRETSRDFWCFD